MTHKKLVAVVTSGEENEGLENRDERERLPFYCVPLCTFGFSINVHYSKNKTVFKKSISF